MKIKRIFIIILLALVTITFNYKVKVNATSTNDAGTTSYSVTKTALSQNSIILVSNMMKVQLLLVVNPLRNMFLFLIKNKHQIVKL